MESKGIRRNLYKVLRKTGIPREHIKENASLENELLYDEVDMVCFLYYLESKFKITVSKEEMPNLTSVSSTIEFLQKHVA